LIINLEPSFVRISETFIFSFISGRTSSNKGSALDAGQSGCAAAEESGMPCPVPIQPYSAKVCYRHFTCTELFILFVQSFICL